MQEKATLGMGTKHAVIRIVCAMQRKLRRFQCLTCRFPLLLQWHYFPTSHQDVQCFFNGNVFRFPLALRCEASLILTFLPCAVAVKNYRQRQKDAWKHSRCPRKVGAGYFYCKTSSVGLNCILQRSCMILNSGYEEWQVQSNFSFSQRW